MNNRIQKKVVITFFLGAGLIFLLTMGNLAYVGSNPGGFDFLANWHATRSLFSNGADPYSDQTANAINSQIRQIDSQVKGQYRFVSPLISFVFISPFSLIKDFTAARVAWMTFQELLVILSGWFISLWIHPRQTRSFTFFTIIMLMLFIPMLISIHAGSLVIIGFSLLVSSVFFLVRNQDEPAGFLLALASISLDLIYPLIVFLVAWAIRNKRGRFAWWFFGTLVLLIGFSLVLVPNWPISYFRSIVEYSSHNPVREIELAPTALAVRLLLVKNLIILTILIYEWFVIKIAGVKRLLWIIGILMVASIWLGGVGYVDHTILLIPAMFIGLDFFKETWKEKTKLTAIVFPLIIVGVSWIFSGLVFPLVVDKWNNVVLMIILPSLVLLLLYWSRWWVIRQEKYNIDVKIRS